MITTVRYSFGDEVKCTVIEYCSKVGDKMSRCYLLLDTPRIIQKEENEYYIKSPSKWYGEVQELGKHKCGKPFTCSCCGRDFPANAGTIGSNIFPHEVLPCKRISGIPSPDSS